MPMYEYECQECKRKETAFRSMDRSSEPLVLLDWECRVPKCPKKLERIISFANGKVVDGTPKHHA